MVGHPSAALGISPSQARRITVFLMPDKKVADSGGYPPHTRLITGAFCFQDKAGAVVRFTIHKTVFPARIALAAFGFGSPVSLAV